MLPVINIAEANHTRRGNAIDSQLSAFSDVDDNLSDIILAVIVIVTKTINFTLLHVHVFLD